MLIFNFNKLFQIRGINKPFSYLRQNGYSPNESTRIANSQMTTLSLKQLEKLCYLLKCTPNDIIEWIPNNKKEDKKTHPLYLLKKTDNSTNILEIINTLPIEKIKEIELLISQSLKK